MDAGDDRDPRDGPDRVRRGDAGQNRETGLVDAEQLQGRVDVVDDGAAERRSGIEPQRPEGDIDRQIDGQRDQKQADRPLKTVLRVLDIEDHRQQRERRHERRRESGLGDDRYAAGSAQDHQELDDEEGDGQENEQPLLRGAGFLAWIRPPDVRDPHRADGEIEDRERVDEESRRKAERHARKRAPRRSQRQIEHDQQRGRGCRFLGSGPCRHCVCRFRLLGCPCARHGSRRLSSLTASYPESCREASMP